MLKRWIVYGLLICLLIPALSAAAVASEMEASQNTMLRIAILDEPSLHRDGNAPYGGEALRDLFVSKGHSADLLNAEQFASADLMNTDRYDLAFLPSGSAFPASCSANLKAFFGAGGRLITSGGYAFSEPIYPESSGEEVYGQAAYVRSDSSALSPSLYRKINANQLRDSGSYTLSLQVKTENISTEKGLAHASVYIYGAGEKLLEWRDFATYTSGSTDWDTKAYNFSVPAAAEHVDVILGLYIAAGTIAFDDIEIVSKEGKTVFSENFENGIAGWSRMVTAPGMTYETGKGVLQASDFCSYLNVSQASGEAGLTYDITELAKKNKDLLVRFEEKYLAAVPLDGGRSGASIRLFKDGIEVEQIALTSASGSFGWHRRDVSASVGDTDFDMALLDFAFAKTEGTLMIDSVSVQGGDTVLTEDDLGEPDYYGGASKKRRDDELMRLGSNDPLTAGDQLFFADDSIPIFDIESTFADCVSVKGADDQAVFTPGETVLEGTGISGFSALTTTGNNRGRWQPLLNVYDAFGQQRGTAAAVFTVFNTPSDYGALGSVKTWNAYSGTSLGFFGVTDRDLFAEGNGELRDGLVRLAEHLCLDPKLCSVSNSYDCYRQGETPKVTVGVENHGKASAQCTMVAEIVEEDTGKVVFTDSADGKLTPGKRKYFRINWSSPEFEDDFYYVRVRIEQDGRVLDRMETGFVVWNAGVVSKGPKYTYHDNYIHLVNEDGTEKAVYVAGVDEGGPFIMENQTPVSWKEDFRKRADAGILLYETLQQYRDYGDYSAVFATEGSFETHMRKVDAAVYLSQRYGQIYMMGMLIGSNTAVGDEQLEKDKDFIRTMAARYRDVPGIVFYLNGDLVIRIGPDTDPLFRDYLKQQYKTDEAFQEAWGTSKTLDSITFDAAYSFNGSGWTDTKAFDQNVFRTQLVNRWNNALTRAAKEGGGEEKAVVCEFYAWPADGADVPYGIGELTYSNTGFFDRLPIFAQTLAYSDQRWQGKSFGIGESNKRTHPSFTDTLDYYQSDSYTHARAYFFTTYYTTFAMGGNHHQVWCWKDETKYVFPWGLNTVYEVCPKDSYYWERNSNYITRTMEPVYTAPEVAIVTPDSTRMAGSRGWYEGHYNAVNAIHILQGTLCDGILTLNECNFSIPESVKVLFYPSAYTVPDDVYEKLVAFVKNGGILYLSGDPSYDPVSRKRTLESRLTELAGVSASKVLYAGNDRAGAAVTYSDGNGSRTGYPNIQIEAKGADVLYKDGAGIPVITRFTLGKGQVVFSADPFENTTNADTFREDVRIYRSVLKLGGIAESPLTASTASIKTFVLPLADGGTFREVLNTSAADVRLELTSGGKSYEFKLGAYATAYFREDKDGNLISNLTSGNLSRDSVRLLTNGSLAQLHATDGKDLFSSERLVILPQTEGNLSILSGADWSKMKLVSVQIFDNAVVTGNEVPFTFDADKGSVSFKVDKQLCNTVLLAATEEQLESLKETVGKTLNRAISLKNGEEQEKPSEPGDPSIPIAIGAGVGIVALTGLTTVLVMRKKNKPSAPAEKPEPDGPDGGSADQDQDSEKKEE